MIYPSNVSTPGYQPTRASTQQPFTYLSKAGIDELFKPGNLTLGVNVGCAPLDTGEFESNDTLRTVLVKTSNASAAIAKEEVRIFMRSAQDIRDNHYSTGTSFREQIEGSMRQLKVSQSGFTAIPLGSEDYGKLLGVQEITVNDFPLKKGQVKSRKTEDEDPEGSKDDDVSSHAGSDNEEFDRLLAARKEKPKKNSARKGV
jgi:hypothetical protein